MKNFIVTEREVGAIISGMPIGIVARFTYQGNPTRILLDEMDEDSQFTAMLILAKCRGVKIDDIINQDRK